MSSGTVIGSHGMLANGSVTIAANSFESSSTSTGITDITFEPVIVASGNGNTNVVISTLSYVGGSGWVFKAARQDTPDEALTVYWKVIALKPARKV
tara:strand:- start:5972 stop:6259 length:288 start_codon:yes stop_codon:yes gene_type:complete